MNDKNKKTLLENEVKELYKLIFEKENEIIEIDKKLALFSDITILDNMKLSDKQELIVNSDENNILVVACPGSGKTHTLISRYIKLCINNIKDKDGTLLITFTKKAGMEMLNRLNNIVPNKLPYYVGSLHGLSYKVLQEYHNINYTILDEKESNEYLKSIITDDFVKSKLSMIIEQASSIYPFDLKPILKKHNLEKYYKDFNSCYKLYQLRKKKENLVDFNDLMNMFAKFLDDDKSENFKLNLKYIFFDEYQDINPIQNYILLKLSKYAKIMVVGDDAQSIYSFRGSSVSYILNFNDNNKIYLLEENYRSTPAIVNFCQDIIKNNIKQIEKTVISKQENYGFKPCVYGFKTGLLQYKWIVEDIIKKRDEGVKLSDIVIMSRKNNLLENIELELIKNKVSYVKNNNLSLLNKNHVKDFLAFIITFNNPKSSIHWKRLICLHPNYDIKKAFILLENKENILQDVIKVHFETLYNKINSIKKIKKDIDKAREMVSYLETLWNNINYKKDIYKLMNNLRNSSLEEFISELYLNIDIENDVEEGVFLTTIHGSKGLEWSHVYIIDMNSKEFPSIRTKYYMDEIEDNDEERRLFYVAASRAKKYLTITYHENLNNNEQILISPLLREINNDLYKSSNVNLYDVQLTGIISKDMNNYIKYIGYNKIATELLNLKNNRYSVNKYCEFSSSLEEIYLGTFIDLLISKMLQYNFNNKIKKFELHNINENLKNYYAEYIDSSTDWKDIIEVIFNIAFHKNINKDNFKNLLINNINNYLEIEKGICKIINNIKAKDIKPHYIVSMGDFKGEVDILCDDTLIEIKTSMNNEIATISNISQTLIYSYLLKKKDIKINKIIIYNPLTGCVNEFNIDNFDITNFKKMMYN